MTIKKIHLPCNKNVLSNLKSGDTVRVSGSIFMARDAAHIRMTDYYKVNGEYPIELKGQGIYYAGPAPAAPNKVIGPAGPTTSLRMDTFTPDMLKEGMVLMIGKGDRSQKVTDAIVKYKAVYLAATGGVAALLSKSIKKQEIIAYKELGAEALRKIYIEDFPAVVIIDSNGNNLYDTGKEKYKETEIKNDWKD